MFLFFLKLSIIWGPPSLDVLQFKLPLKLSNEFTVTSQVVLYFSSLLRLRRSTGGSWNQLLVHLHRCCSIGPGWKRVQIKHHATPAVNGQSDAANADNVHYNSCFSLWRVSKRVIMAQGWLLLSCTYRSKGSPCLTLWGSRRRRQWHWGVWPQAAWRRRMRWACRGSSHTEGSGR